MKKRFIPREKLSKKARRALDSERRAVWIVPPVQRVVESKKAYDRKRDARGRYDEYGPGVSLSVFFTSLFCSCFLCFYSKSR